MRRLIAALLLSLILIGLAPGEAEGIDRPRVAAARAVSEIRVDGILDEPDWARAAPIRDFRLIFQREGQAPSESTEVRALCDGDRLIFGIRCENRGPGPIRASLVPRDRIDDGDFVAIHLDTYRDMRRAYMFGVNPYGVQLDGILDADTPDFSWDAVWDAEVTRDALGWTAEIAVPLRSIRFPRGADTWGLWIRRQITKNDEICSWPLWRQAEQGDIMLQAADLTGLAGLRGGGPVEAEPYLRSITNRATSYSFGSPTPGGPLSLSTDHFQHTTVDVGGDLRYALTSTLIANATVNPDYSQVEADAIQIDANRRYPLFYEEKRPFFLEGAELFTTPLQLVYTRRIADPALGAKLTGKQGRLSVGAISLRDDGGGSSEGVGAGSGDGALRPGEFHIARAGLDLGENSRLGFLAAYHRSDDEAGGFQPAVIPYGPVPRAGHNVVLAADSRLKLGARFSLTGQLAWSETRTDSLTITAAGRSTSRGTRSDAAYHASLHYGDGVREIEAFQTYLGPEFRDESGFIERVDMRKTGINSNFIVRPENRWIRSWQPILEGYTIHDRTGGLQEWWVSPMVDWVFQKQTTMHTMYERSMERWLGRDYDLGTWYWHIENTLWRPLAMEFEIEAGDGIFYGATPAESYKGWAETMEIGVTARPDPRLTSEITVNRSRFSRSAGGPEVFDVWVIGAKTTYQFTRRLYARVYPQVETGTRHVDADALLGYVIHPGSVIYLGLNGDYDRINGRQRQTQRTVFFKASHRFGI